MVKTIGVLLAFALLGTASPREANAQADVSLEDASASASVAVKASAEQQKTVARSAAKLRASEMRSENRASGGLKLAASTCQVVMQWGENDGFYCWTHGYKDANVIRCYAVAKVDGRTIKIKGGCTDNFSMCAGGGDTAINPCDGSLTVGG